MTEQRPMTRNERRLHNKSLKHYPKALTLVHEDDWPKFETSVPRIACWRSRDWLVQLFEEPGGVVRISVCSTIMGPKGWADGITWDVLQQIKDGVGYADFDAMEIYPARDKIVNVANMRHLWVMPQLIAQTWR